MPTPEKNDPEFSREKPGSLRNAARKIIEFFIKTEPEEPPPDMRLDRPPAHIPESQRNEWFVPEGFLGEEKENGERHRKDLE